MSMPEVVGNGKKKQDVIVADASASNVVTLWENNVVGGKSYRLSKLVVQSFKN